MPFPTLLRAVPVLAVLVFPATLAKAADIMEFMGSYKGSVVMQNADGVTPRDTNVTISGNRETFTVSWSTVTKRPDGSRKEKSYSIDFKGSDRRGIFESAMRKNKFGARTPLDPMKGDPYVWARLEGKTLSVFAMLITPEGGYEMQQYDRTLTDDGLKLVFTRFGEQGVSRSIEADLTRTD